MPVRFQKGAINVLNRGAGGVGGGGGGADIYLYITYMTGFRVPVGCQ